MENNCVVFGIDVDGVIRDTLDYMLNMYNNEFGTNLTRESVRDFRVSESFPLVKEKLGVDSSWWFFEKNGRELFLKSKSIKGADDAICGLRKLGKVILVTNQKTFENKIDTLLWLEMNKIEYDDICFMKDKSRLDCDYLIDDNELNFDGCKAKHAILIDAPYNEYCNLAVILNKSKCKDVTRFNSLSDFVSWYDKNIN